MSPKPSPSQVYKFRASSLREAIDIVREEFGPDAQVLRTREVSRAGMFNRLLGRSDVEVTVASVDYEFEEADESASDQRSGQSKHQQRKAANDANDSVGLDLSSMHGDEEDRSADNRDDYSTSYHGTHDYRFQIEQRLNRAFNPQEESAAESHSEDSNRSGQSLSFNALRAWPDSAFQLYTMMLEADVENEIARKAIQIVLDHVPARQQSNFAIVQEPLQQLLQSWLPTSGGIRVRNEQHIVALIGPTGVGKTTTVAKIAANARLIENRRVGLITMDTYRIAAVDQLRTYAEIIELPLFVATNPREVREALQRMQDVDLILIDTAGRSPRDDAQISELEKMLAAAQPHETHLVLSCSQSAHTLVQTANRFARANFSHLLLTKLDEALALGPMLSLTHATERPISYITTGQNVPDDIEIAEPSNLVARMLNTNHRDGTKHVA